jgi:hypothetical protein
VILLDLEGFFSILERIIIHLKFYVVLCGVREENQHEALVGGNFQSGFVALDCLNELLLREELFSLLFENHCIIFLFLAENDVLWVIVPQINHSCSDLHGRIHQAKLNS